MGNLSAEFLVLHHEDLQLLDVVDKDLNNGDVMTEIYNVQPNLKKRIRFISVPDCGLLYLRITIFIHSWKFLFTNVRIFRVEFVIMTGANSAETKTN